MKIWNFVTMSQTLTPFKLFTTNFLEALVLKGWILILKSPTGQKEIENDLQDLEHRPKMCQNFDKKIGPNFGQDDPGTIEQYYFPSWIFKTVSTSHLRNLLWIFSKTVIFLKKFKISPAHFQRPSGAFKGSQNLQNCDTMRQTFTTFKLFTTNFLEPLALKIWILT